MGMELSKATAVWYGYVETEKKSRFCVVCRPLLAPCWLSVTWPSLRAAYWQGGPRGHSRWICFTSPRVSRPIGLRPGDVVSLAATANFCRTCKLLRGANGLPCSLRIACTVV